MTSVKISITAFIDEGFSGWIECQLVDAHGKTWKFHEKVPVITAENLWSDSEYPRPGFIGCTVLGTKSDPSGQQIVTVDTSGPWAIESIDGTTVFEVFAEQIDGSAEEPVPIP